MAAFAIAMAMHVATNLLHLRADLQQRAAGIARGAGVRTIEALGRGDTPAAVSALNVLRDEPMVDVAEIYLPSGQKIAAYDRAANGVLLNPAAAPQAVRGNQFQITASAAHEG